MITVIFVVYCKHSEFKGMFLLQINLFIFVTSKPMFKSALSNMLNDIWQLSIKEPFFILQVFNFMSVYFLNVFNTFSSVLFLVSVCPETYFDLFTRHCVKIII